MPTRVAHSRQFLQANRRNVSPSLASLNAFEMQEKHRRTAIFRKKKEKILLPVLLFLNDAEREGSIKFVRLYVT